MAGRPGKVPSYCRHKASGQAVVRIDGTDHYLGTYGSPERRERYQRVFAEQHSNGRSARNLATPFRGSDFTIVKLMAALWEHVQAYYLKNGEPTSVQNSLQLVLRTTAGYIILSRFRRCLEACERSAAKLDLKSAKRYKRFWAF